jgi:hypothetical protein
VVCVVALAGGVIWYLFAQHGPASVAVPTAPPAKAAAECAALTADAPATVDGQKRRKTSPVSPLTAAWGDPAITLRCGVAEPGILVAGNPGYDPEADEAYLNGLAWLIQQTSDGYTFTAVQRAVYVEVDVPNAYTPQTDPLIDLGNALLKAIPRDDGKPGPDDLPLASPSP